MRSVLVTRPQPMADEFAERLRRKSFTVYLAPMMEYVEMEAGLDDLEHYQALVFTSAQTVQVFSRRSRERRLPVLAVGDATAEAASKAGFSRVYSAKGSGDDVTELIRGKAKELSLKKILHPCSEDTPHSITIAARGFGVKVVQRPLYKARFLERLPDDVLWALQDNSIDTVTLFSARTAANFVRLLQQDNLRGVSAKMKAVCISERVAAAVKDIPWREVTVSPRPDTESMLETLKGQKPPQADDAPLPVEAVIQAFGGIRLLANRLKITPSTVQGWKKRGIIPEIRTEAVLRAAREDGIDISRLRSGKTETAAVQSRAALPAQDPGRKQRQQDPVMHEKIRFLKRAALTFFAIASVVGLLGYLLLAPEYSYVERLLKNLRPAAESDSQRAGPSFGGELSSQIEKIQNASTPLIETVGRMTASVFSGSPQGLRRLLEDVASLRQTPEGGAAVESALNTLRSLLLDSSGSAEDVSAAVLEARRRNPALDSLLEQAGIKDMAAAAMLLTLNEFRSNFDNHRPYAQDLALLQKLAGGDPGMNRALQRLAPYAEKGVMSRAALQNEFAGLTAGIVTAKMQGRSLSVKEDALRRLDRLVKAGNAGDIRGEEAEAVVARAQVLLNQGDIKGAMHELQALEGAPAEAAEPWMDDAAGYVLAGQSSDDLTRGALQAISGDIPSAIKSFLSSLKEVLRGPDVPYLSPALKKGGGGYEGVVSAP